VNEWNQDEGLPVVEMGIGTHSGDVVVGNIGSEMRAKFGIVGATINMTSRVESCTVGGQVLISEATRQRCGEALTLGSSQSLSLKGVQGTLEVHEVLAVGSPFDVRLDQAREDLAPPAHHLAFRFAVVKGKNVGELTESAVAVTLSKLGAEIRVAGTLEALSNLQLRVVGEDGSLHAGDLYAKVLRAGSEPGVFYVRWTSVPDVVQPILDRAIAPDPAVLGAPAAP